jgi:excisionase family DNA binding protein
MPRPPLHLSREEVGADFDDVPTNSRNTLRGSAPLPTVLCVDEVARLLRINRKTVYEAVAKRLLPGAQRLGRTIRVDRDTLLVWMKGHPGVLHSKLQGRVASSGGRHGGATR